MGRACSPPSSNRRMPKKAGHQGPAAPREQTMRMRLSARAAALAASAAFALAAAIPAKAEEISVTHWGTLMYGTPYAVALKMGFFKEAGVNVTGILTSKGGGTTVRNVLEGGLPYGEVALSAAVAAMQENTDIKIVIM